MARAELIKYIRTDKNGTKIFYDFTCPRCCGYGMLDKWINTGKVCYACGGSGVRAKAKIVKEYSEEYLEKLQSRREARAMKYAEEHADEIATAKAEQERMAEETRKYENKRTCEKLGCNADGIGYVLTGNTYPVKEQIKANGGKWVAQAWVSPVEISAKCVKCVRIDLNKYTNEYGRIDEFDCRDAIWEIGGRR